MKIADFLDPAMVIPSLRSKDKEEVLKEMADWMASQDPSMDAERLVEALLKKAKEKGTTWAIGEGVAIPHARVSSIRRLSGLFARSQQGVSFDSIDGNPSYLFFLLIEPENVNVEHLKALARISRLLKDPAFRALLLAAKTKEDIFKVIREEDDKF